MKPAVLVKTVDEQLEDALLVFLLEPKLAEYLTTHDPMAVRQAWRAVNRARAERVK